MIAIKEVVPTCETYMWEHYGEVSAVAWTLWEDCGLPKGGSSKEASGGSKRQMTEKKRKSSRRVQRHVDMGGKQFSSWQTETIDHGERRQNQQTQRNSHIDTGSTKGPLTKTSQPVKYPDLDEHLLNHLHSHRHLTTSTATIRHHPERPGRQESIP